MFTYAYSVKLTPDKEDGGYVVTFSDWPEAITQGDTIEGCLAEAQDCLDEALAGRIELSEDIPTPCRKSRYMVSPSLQIAVKASLYLAMKEQNVRVIDLARQLEIDEKAVRRMIDPRHGTKLAAMQSALETLGKHPTLQIA